MLNRMLSYAACFKRINSYLFPGWQVEIKWNREAPSFYKFQRFFNWLQKNCNRKLESNEYMSCTVSSARVSPSWSRSIRSHDDSAALWRTCM